MFTHKIISKDIDGQGLVFGIQFTDGTHTYTESVRPQDENGLKYFLRQRIASLNSINDLSHLKVGDSVVLDDTPVVLTPEEIKAQEYEARKFELIRLKQEVELGLATQEELDAKVQETKAVKEADADVLVASLDIAADISPK